MMRELAIVGAAAGLAGVVGLIGAWLGGRRGVVARQDGYAEGYRDGYAAGFAEMQSRFLRYRESAQLALRAVQSAGGTVAPELLGPMPPATPPPRRGKI